MTRGRDDVRCDLALQVLEPFAAEAVGLGATLDRCWGLLFANCCKQASADETQCGSASFVCINVLNHQPVCEFCMETCAEASDYCL